jgi:5-methyltetrahydropteroyltriglutamate--homocysteine methyltransferase
MVEAHLAGVFPRSEKLVAATRAVVRGNLQQSEADAVLREDVRSLILLQDELALDAFVDGQLNWQDLFRPFTQILAGIEPGGLTRWFDNNTFYRKPVIAEKVAFKGDNLQQYFRVDLLPEHGRKKAILPGPVTFALLSDNRAYPSLSDLVDDLAHALKGVVKGLQGFGYEYFQFNEPSICASNRTSSELETVKRAFETCAGGKSMIQTYFGDANRAIETLLDCPVDGIGVDFYATSLESLSEYDFDKTLGCGCIDGRNSLLESPRDLKEIILNVRDGLEPRDIYLTPNCDLEFLPRSVAEKKVRTLSETRRLLTET